MRVLNFFCLFNGGRTFRSKNVSLQVILLALTLIAGWPAPAGADVAASDSCECLQSSCGPCEMEAGTSFYSAKCGVDKTQVKSCKRVKCTPVENQKECLALFHLPGGATASKLTDAKSPLTDPEASLAAREIAINAPEAGQITDLSGDTRVTHSNGVIEKPRKRDTAYVGDTFQTGADGRVKVLLRDGSEMTLAADSKLKLEKVDVDAASMKRQIAMRILAGKVRNKVQKEYNGENFYQVKTRTAVAGVRGTDFITSFEPGTTEWVSEIRTIEGLVKLQSSQPDVDGGGPASVDVPAGTYASVINDISNRDPASFDEDSLAKHARVTPLYKIKEDELRKLKDTVEFLSSNSGLSRARRSVASDASANEDVCQEPLGKYNQCSWTCEHNPKGESKCRTDLPEVSCVRRLCRANGLWSEEHRLPASEGKNCDGSRSVVADCDGYW